MHKIIATPKIENIIIIGSGPSAHTAAIYAARAGLTPLVFEGDFTAGTMPGGQLTTTTEIENFPGFENGISGIELMDKMRNQSLKFNARIETRAITDVDLAVTPFKVYADKDVFLAKSLIIATGATALRLGIKGEAEYWQKGISACAVCDGGLPLYRNKVLAVIGGGDSAIEEATYLTKFASKVVLCVRRDKLRASKIMQDRLLANPKVQVLWNTEVLEALGNGHVLTGLRLLNKQMQEETVLDVSGLFYAVGHKPNTDFLKGQLALDELGYVQTKPDSTATTVAGVFAAGDVKSPKFRQAILAAGSGCLASLEAEHFLEQHV